MSPYSSPNLFAIFLHLFTLFVSIVTRILFHIRPTLLILPCFSVLCWFFNTEKFIGWQEICFHCWSEIFSSNFLKIFNLSWKYWKYSNFLKIIKNKRMILEQTQYNINLGINLELYVTFIDRCIGRTHIWFTLFICDQPAQPTSR